MPTQIIFRDSTHAFRSRLQENPSENTCVKARFTFTRAYYSADSGLHLCCCCLQPNVNKDDSAAPSACLSLTCVCVCVCVFIELHMTVQFDPVIVQPILSTCLLYTNSGCGKKEAHINSSMVTCKDNTRYSNYLENYWPCAGGLSAVNTIASGTQLRDPINSGLTQWRMAV